MRDKIWYEMFHIKFGDSYLANYLNRQKTKRKWFKIFTLVFSTSGILGWTVWKYAPIIACGLIAVMQIVTLIENQIIPSDQDIEDVAGLRNKYISYFNKLEKLWIDFENNRVDEKEAGEQFYKLREIGADIEATDNKLHIDGQIKTIYKVAETETKNYFNQYHS
jgi:hypothetical protein